jgi:hypothetical protein
MLQDFINNRMPKGHNQVSIEELLSLQKIWMLLLIYKTSYTSMIADAAFYNPCTTVLLDAKRYKAIIRAGTRYFGRNRMGGGESLGEF